MRFNRKERKVDEARQHPFLNEFLSKTGYQAPEDDKKLARLKASYFGLMSEVDQNLGVLFDYLKKNDFWDNTLIIFTSDHGEQIGDHWLLGKLGYFDESYHIPLIIRDPSNHQNKGKIIEEYTENVDVMPTMLDWFDLPIPVQCDGQSLLPFLKNDKTPAAACATTGSLTPGVLQHVNMPSSLPCLVLLSLLSRELWGVQKR
mgnify:CR=1 FL=1